MSAALFYRGGLFLKLKNCRGRFESFLTCGLAGHGEQGGDAERGPARHGVHVHPERDPGDHNDEDGGNVGLDHVKAHRARQVKPGHQTAVIACRKVNRT